LGWSIGRPYPYYSKQDRREALLFNGNYANGPINSLVA